VPPPTTTTTSSGLFLHGVRNDFEGAAVAGTVFGQHQMTVTVKQ
jgi:hypothetical protein